MNCISEFASVMKGYFKKLSKDESRKMRDVAFGPGFYIMQAMPIVLVIVVIVLVIIAAIKVANISARRKAEQDKDRKDDLQ